MLRLPHLLSLFLALALPAAVQATEPYGAGTPNRHLAHGSVGAVAPHDSAYIPLSLVGAASGVAPLDTGALVPRTNLPTDMLNLMQLGSAANGYASDQTKINSILNANPGGQFEIPNGFHWPADTSGINPYVPTKPAGQQYFFHEDGNAYTGGGNGYSACTALGDADLTECWGGGTLNFLRHTRSGSPGSPTLHIAYENSSSGFQMNGYPFNQGTSALQINAQNDHGANGSIIGEEIELNTFDDNPFTDENVGYSVNVYKAGQGSTWQFSGQTQDNTGLPPASFAAVAAELDILANGPDAPQSMYDPGQSNRWFIYLAPKENPTSSWAKNTTVTTGTLTTATNAAGVSTVYIATTGGTSGVTTPKWPNGGTVMDGTVTWTYGEPYAVSVGAGIWLDNGETNLTSYSAGFATNARFDDAVIDLSRAVLTGANGAGKGAAIRVAANEPIDFSGNATQAGQNQHTLQYSTASNANALIYQTPSGVAFSIADSNQAAKFNGSLGVAGLTVLGTSSTASLAGVNSGYNSTALTVGYNHLGSGETDLVAGSGGLQIFAASSAGAITQPSLAMDAAGNTTMVGTLKTGMITSSGNITGAALVGSVGAGIAAAGTSQATATVLKAQDNAITSCALGAGVELPAAVIGEQVRVLNRGSTACRIYPPSGGQIEAAGVNAATTLAAGADATFEAFTATQWYQ